jgi:hypothetical protein
MDHLWITHSSRKRVDERAYIQTPNRT